MGTEVWKSSAKRSDEGQPDAKTPNCPPASGYSTLQQHHRKVNPVQCIALRQRHLR